MNAVLDFIKAAAPYAAAGTALAFFAVRAAVRKKKGGERDGSCSLEGMCFGLLFGTAFGDNNGIGILLGMLVGLAVGACFQKSLDK